MAEFEPQVGDLFFWPRSDVIYLVFAKLGELQATRWKCLRHINTDHTQMLDVIVSYLDVVKNGDNVLVFRRGAAILHISAGKLCPTDG